MSDSLRLHGLQCARLACLSPNPGAYSKSCPSSQWCHPTSHPLSSPSLSDINLSQHQGFSNESVLPIRWPKYWSFSFSISPSNEHSGLISFRMDWLDLLADLLFIISCFKLLLEGESLYMYMYKYMYKSEWCHTSLNKCLFPEWIYVQKLDNIVCNKLWIILPSICVVGFQGKKMLVMSESFWQRYM